MWDSDLGSRKKTRVSQFYDKLFIQTPPIQKSLEKSRIHFLGYHARYEIISSQHYRHF